MGETATLLTFKAQATLPLCPGPPQPHPRPTSPSRCPTPGPLPLPTSWGGWAGRPRPPGLTLALRGSCLLLETGASRPSGCWALPSWCPRSREGPGLGGSGCPRPRLTVPSTGLGRPLCPGEPPWAGAPQIRSRPLLAPCAGREPSSLLRSSPTASVSLDQALPKLCPAPGTPGASSVLSLPCPHPRIRPQPQNWASARQASRPP